MPGSEEEKQAIVNAVDRAKGAQEAGKVIILAAPNKDKLPVIQAIPTNQNDKLFENTDRRIDDKICQAHTIAPVLMGIQTPGKLGAGQDIKTSYQIFEKNMVMPARESIETFINELLFIGNVQAKYKINNFQIIGDEIVDNTDNIK
jgi:capsid portal protein